MYFFLLLCFLLCGYVWVDFHFLHYFKFFMVEFFHVLGFSISSMDVIILLLAC